MASVAKARAQLLAHALSLPGAWEDHPWDEDVAKVGKKVFVFFGRGGSDLLVGVKLPRSLLLARTLAFVRKFGYGMDASGWVAAKFAKGDAVPVDLLRGWIDESYEAVVAKRRAASPREVRDEVALGRYEAVAPKRAARAATVVPVARGGREPRSRKRTVT